jgi:hypothetical protein
MLVAIIVGSVTLLALLLWIFNRLAWGGGLRSPSYEFFKPPPAAAAAERGAGLPIADRDSIELRCAQCAYVRPLPESSQLPVLLANIAAQTADPGEIQKPCPECGGVLKSWLRREITHFTAGGPVQFAVLRRGPRRLYDVGGQIYPTVQAIPEPQRSTVAEATNATEDQ